MYAEARTRAAAAISKMRKGKTNGHQGMKRSEETKARMSAAQTGKKHTAEHRANMSAVKMGQLAGILKSDEHKASLSIAATGREHTQDTKDKLSSYFKGRPQDPIVVAKRAASQRGMVKERQTCPHCSKIGAKGAMQRWHFDNCKHKDGE
jgi:hypothetical protein